MDDNKKRNILIVLLGVILLMLIFIIYLLISNNHRSNNNDVDYDKLEIVDTNMEVVDEEASIDDEIDTEVVADTADDDNKTVEVSNNNAIDNNDIVTDDNVKEDNNTSYSEDDVVNYFENNEKKIRNSFFKEMFKDYFIEIVDFIFYGTEIKGHTFNDLTNTGKLKVIGAAIKIDNFIEEKSPGYKDNIKSTSNKVYTNVKEKLISLFLNISSNICENKEDDCNKAKELFGDIKSTCKIGWSFIKSLLKTGSNKLKDWYEIYSGK